MNKLFLGHWICVHHPKPKIPNHINKKDRGIVWRQTKLNKIAQIPCLLRANRKSGKPDKPL
jgi:hypothetical protein